MGQCLSLFPGNTGIFLRRAYYRMTILECGRDFSIGFLSWIAHRESKIGASVYVGAGCILGTVAIDDDVLIGSNVNILSGRHQHSTELSNVPTHLQGGNFSRTAIGQNVWIGNCSVIMADIGNAAIVGAGSVVVKPVLELEVVAGNPAKFIKSRHQAVIKQT